MPRCIMLGSLVAAWVLLLLMLAAVATGPAVILAALVGVAVTTWERIRTTPNPPRRHRT